MFSFMDFYLPSYYSAVPPQEKQIITVYFFSMDYRVAIHIQMSPQEQLIIKKVKAPPYPTNNILDGFAHKWRTLKLVTVGSKPLGAK